MEMLQTWTRKFSPITFRTYQLHFGLCLIAALLMETAMTSLSEEALHNLCYTALSFADNLFQMWLTITFGAILAIYFSHSDITPYLRRLLIGLYLGASIMLIGRWCVAIFYHFLTYQTQLIENGWLPFPTPENARILGVLHLLLYLIGTAATLYFMVNFVGRENTKPPKISGNSA